MPLFRGIKNRNSKTHFLVLDVGTDCVKAAIVEPSGKHGKIIGFGKQKQKNGSMHCGKIIDLAATIEAGSAAIKQAENRAGVSTNKMIIGVSGELVKGATHTTSYVRRDPSAKIDLSELKNIVHKIQWRAFEVIRSQIAFETGYNEIDIKLINAAITDTQIDGYRVSNPIGFQGKEVTLSVFNAFSPTLHFGALQTIAAEIDRELIAIASEPYALALSLIDERNKFSGILIDVGCDTTDIALIVDNVILGTRMFAIGGRTFSKRLSTSLNISFYDAEAIKLSYCSDNLERQSHRIVREALKPDCDLWLSGVVLTLKEFTNIEHLPERILLSGAGSHLPEIKEALETREWVKSLAFDKKPQISFFNPKQIENLSFDNSVFNDHQDIMTLALAKMGMTFIGEEAISTKVLKKVVRLMNI